MKIRKKIQREYQICMRDANKYLLKKTSKKIVAYENDDMKNLIQQKNGLNSSAMYI